MLRDQNGFSLIELMVVVAIIGILSAVAVPQFQKFQRKAKQAEGKASLAAIFTAQKVFRAETGTYYANFWTIGYEPDGVVRYRQLINPSSSTVTNVPGYDIGIYTATGFPDIWGICHSSFSTGLSSNCMTAGVAGGFPYIGNFGSHYSTFITTSDTFKVGAGSFLKSGTLDIWTIDHKKELINIVNGAL